MSILSIAFDFRSPARDSHFSSFVGAGGCGSTVPSMSHTTNSALRSTQQAASIWMLCRAEARPWSIQHFL